jgi:hypothetical protein
MYSQVYVDNNHSYREYDDFVIKFCPSRIDFDDEYKIAQLTSQVVFTTSKKMIYLYYHHQIGYYSSDTLYIDKSNLQYTVVDNIPLNRIESKIFNLFFDFEKKEIEYIDIDEKFTDCYHDVNGGLNVSKKYREIKYKKDNNKLYIEFPIFIPYDANQLISQYKNEGWIETLYLIQEEDDLVV